MVVVNYGDQSAEVWWEKNRSALMRHDNLTVIGFDAATVAALRGESLAALLAHTSAAARALFQLDEAMS